MVRVLSLASLSNLPQTHRRNTCQRGVIDPAMEMEANPGAANWLLHSSHFKGLSVTGVMADGDAQQTIAETGRAFPLPRSSATLSLKLSGWNAPVWKP